MMERVGRLLKRRALRHRQNDRMPSIVDGPAHEVFSGRRFAIESSANPEGDGGPATAELAMSQVAATRVLLHGRID